MLDFFSCASWPSVCLLWKMCILVLYPLFYLKYSWYIILYKFSSVQSLSHVQFFVTPWITHAKPHCPSPTPRSSLKLTSIKLVMPSSHLILCRPLSPCPQSLPASESFPMSQLFAWGGQSTEVSVIGIQYSDILILYPFFYLQYNWCIIL